MPEFYDTLYKGFSCTVDENFAEINGAAAGILRYFLRSITFDFVPKIVIIFLSAGNSLDPYANGGWEESTILVYGGRLSEVHSYLGDGTGVITYSFDGNRIKFHAVAGPYQQLNGANREYKYFAIG